MRMAYIPGTALNVSQISLGTAAFGTAVREADTFALLDAFVESGGNLLDTAHVYADWFGGERHMSEKTIGRWLKHRGHGNDVVIATKGGHPELSTPHISRLAPEQIVADVDESLVCLGRERIDLYYLHRDDPQRDVAEIMETLASQVQAGKIGSIACSNWQPWRIRAAQDYARAHGLPIFVASQIFWSLAVANPGAFASDHALMDDAMLSFYTEMQLPVVCYTSQARGFFTRAAAGGLDSLKPDRRRDFENPINLGRLDRAKQLAAALGVSVSAVALAYITSHSFIGIPVVGPLNQAQLADSLSGANLKLTPEQVHFLAHGNGGVA